MLRIRPNSAGTVKANGFKVWYESYGALPKDSGSQTKDIPLVVLHGGPGFPHDYLLPLAELSNTGRPVVFYDQTGCGKSERCRNKAIYTMDFFVDELFAFRKALGLDEIDLLGHSWGAMLALETAVRQREKVGIRSLILASGSPSTQLWCAGTNRLVAAMPDDFSHKVKQLEEKGKVNTPAYQKLTRAFSKRHGCRLRRAPACLRKSRKKFGPKPYKVMWGNNEFVCTGNLFDWSVVDKLASISVPTLITSGRYDESTYKVNLVLRRAIRNSRWKIFQNSAHLAHLEEKERYLQELEAFLTSL
jgi:proline-specific peptidase